MAAVTGSVGHFFIFLNMSRAPLFRKSTSHACNLQQSLIKQRNTCSAYTFIPQIHKSRVQSATESHKTTKHLHRVRPSEKKLRTLRAACAPHQL